ncbi:hypothetical protein ACO1O0_007051 [Amphichorda felina]
MPLEQTITIVNNSGKIIGTGRHLLSVFKEAKGAYHEKKAQLKAEKSTLGRAKTFDYHSHRSVHRHIEYDEYEEEDDDYYYKYQDERPRHRSSVYDAPSETGSRRTSRRSRSVHSRHHRHRDRDRDYDDSGRSRAPLTETNLKTLSEVSSTAPSRAAPPPGNYRSPYAETSRDLVISKMDLTHAEMRSMAPSERRPPTAMTRPRSMAEFNVARRSSHDARAYPPENGHGKEIDMNLAYGDIPPDLQDRTDLDPERVDDTEEDRAKALIQKVETMLDEADCVRHSAATTITHLQKNPDAAAAVALTLAELSAVITKMSPAFLGFLKGGSPAVFGLLASPHFLIGTAAVVGVTVVMFGGWKIVQKVKEAQAAREALAYEGVPNDRPAPMRTQSEFSTGMDEALIIDDELSSIESWRRGIPEFGEDESADMELITPSADRATRDRYGKGKGDEYDDLRSRRSARTAKTSKSSKSRRHGERDVPERKSSKHATAESIAGSERTRKSSKKREKAPLKAIENRRVDDGIDLVMRPKAQRQSNMLKALFKTKKEREMEMLHV